MIKDSTRDPEELLTEGIALGIALIRHGVVRATRDIDAVFDPDPENIDRIKSLAEMGMRPSAPLLTSWQ